MIDRDILTGENLSVKYGIIAFYAGGSNSLGKLYDIADEVEVFVAGRDHMAVVEIAQHGADSDKPPMKHLEVCNRKMPYHATIKRTYQTYKSLFDEYGARSRQAEANEGVDWKALSHAVRIGRQAIEVLTTGNVVFPRVDAEHLLAVKRGHMPYQTVAAEIEELLARIEVVAAESTLRPTPDYAWIDDFVAKAYEGTG